MKLKDLALELLFPEFCQNCKRLGPALCRNCYHCLEFYFEQHFLEEMSKRLQKSCVDEVLVMAKLESGLAKLIEELKYQNARNLAPFLAKLLYRHLQIPPADCLTFVPLHPQKLRSRGYNQCQEIALALGKLTQLPVLDLLIRTKHLEAQAHVKSQKSRLERLQGVFVLRENCTHRVKNKHILILDDVLTTGATLNEVSRVLKLAGARYITGLILASKAK